MLLVGPKGVGNAVDSFNLNEAFFRAHSISSPSSVQQTTVPGNGSLCTTYSIAGVATFLIKCIVRGSAWGSFQQIANFIGSLLLSGKV